LVKLEIAVILSNKKKLEVKVIAWTKSITRPLSGELIKKKVKFTPFFLF